MKNLLKVGLVLCVVLISSCSATKNTANSGRDGSSFEKAIIVESISKEYEYTRKVCSDCEFLGQALLSVKKKHYDRLDYKKPNGEKVSYYFDITSFFGKGF